MIFIKHSLQGRLVGCACISTALGFLIFSISNYFFDTSVLSYCIAVALSLLTTSTWVHYSTHNLMKQLNALNNGMLNILDSDFSISIASNPNDELGALINHFNKASQKLRTERQYIHQRELLLDTVIQNTPLCLVLTDHHHRVIYSNHHAKKLFSQGKAIQGLLFTEVIAQCPDILKDIIQQKKEGIFSMTENGEENFYHFSLGQFTLNTQHHDLYLIKQLTRELHKQEAGIWKKVIRIISHELNNSLAPISSMAHSGQLMLEKNKLEGLDQVFETISERVNHLDIFMKSYARLAKLPLPKMETFAWLDLIKPLKNSYPFNTDGSIPETTGFGDLPQLQQVLLNLLKNAHESGSNADDIQIRIQEMPQFFSIEILDRGTGMSKNVMENALLPFYTTKPTGSGVGLPLCREIILAHNGDFALLNRKNGGLRVTLTLPISNKLKNLNL